MRPLTVEVEGFSTFRDRTSVDFGDADLLAFVGPTGSGKSSIIDAITFALYGSVARYNNVSLVAPVIHQGMSEAKVRLDFELAGRHLVAVRVVRKTKTGATTKEARLEELDGDGTSTAVLASGAKELTETVESLLGLDFTQFTRTVVLPQGEFARFLKDEPGDRQKLLRRLLDLEIYSRMGSLAREQAKSAANRSEVVEAQLGKYTDTSQEALTARRAHAASLAAFAATANERLDAIAAIEANLVELREQVVAVDDRISRLDEIRLPQSEDLATSAAAASARSRLDQARSALAEARDRRTEAADAMVSLGNPEQLQRQHVAAKKATEATAEIVELETKIEEAKEAAIVLESELAVAADAAAERELALRAARVNVDAGQWTALLSVGEPCPVCRQSVEVLPDHDPSAELAAVETATEAAQGALAASKTKVSDAALTIERLETALGNKRRNVADLESELPTDPAGLEERINAAIAGQAATVASDEAVHGAERSVISAEKALSQASEAEQALRQRFNEQRDAVARFDPPQPGGEVLDDWQVLAEWAATQRAEIGAQRDRIATDGKTAAANKKQLTEELETAARPLNLDPHPSRLQQELASAGARTAAEIERLQERLDELDGWRRELAELSIDQQVNDALGRQLSASGFERWLLAEALDDLVQRATVRLLELSSGGYSLLVEDSAFRIVDHRNADEPRDVRTLSGGETFLASLALALALSDSIAELAPIDAPRLGSMFLDEGFGTLDSETLDIVASAIEELSASGRLVGIVTHIEALAERMPVRIEVRKTSTTSTVDRVVQ